VSTNSARLEGKSLDDLCGKRRNMAVCPFKNKYKRLLKEIFPESHLAKQAGK
jgi:hypothetical protein